mgnify:CR=1 FL=1
MKKQMDKLKKKTTSNKKIIVFLVGLFLALLVENPNIKERAIYKAILILPWALPVTIAILSFQGLLNGNYGQINTLLLNLHIIKEPISNIKIVSKTVFMQ